MKKAEHIISHLLNKPTFQNANKAKCFDMLLTHALPKNLRQFVSFCYVKNSTLFIAITHPGLKMELYYKEKLLKSILVMVKKAQPECEIIDFRDIKIFVTNKIEKKSTLEDTVPRYSEHSMAEFENKATDEKLQQQFEKIRQTIKEQLEDG